MFGVGGQKCLLMLLLALFFFGEKQLTEMARGLGQGLRECKRASEGAADEDVPAAPTQKGGSRGGAAGAGDQDTPVGLPHDRRGPGRV